MTCMTASTARSAFSRRRRLRLSAVLAVLTASLVPAVWAGGAGAAAPEGRGYEMVTPADKNFGDLSIGTAYFGDAAAAPTGETASFCTSTAYEGAHLGVVCADYVSMRDAADQRWETAPVSPPYCTINHGDPNHSFNRNDQWQQGISADMRRVVSALPEGGGGCPFEPLDPFAPTPSLNLYMFETGNLASGRLVTPQPGVPGFAGALNTYAGTYQAGSEDLSHIVFKSTGQQTSEVPADGQTRLFEWADGSVRLLTRDTDNVPFATESHLATPTQFWVAFDRFNAVSSDGSRIFFVTPSAGDTTVENPPSGETEIYMRENGAATYHVSESECTSSCGSATGHAKFRYATPDGGKVLFTSPKRLTDDPTPTGINLYMYTHSDDPANDENLTLLTRDDEPADGTATTPELNPNAIGVLGISDDGDDVYFVADGQLVAGGPTETTFVINLYRWQANGGNPELSHLALLSDGDGLWNWSAALPNPDRLVTPDGEHLLLGTNATLDPVADSQGPGESPRDVYRWSEDDGWDCISCPDAGGPNGGFLAELKDFSPAKQSYRERRPISDDGSRVFFNSDTGLVPRDTNGARDVYMWEDGTVSLVTSGKSPAPSFWIGSSAEGDDVFFTTRERLVGWDVDSNADLYDARVGGGFPEPPASPAPCSGEECQNPPAGSPAAPGSGSADFEGSGNVGARARSSISGVRGLSAAARSALATGGKARLRLKVNRAGKVTVVGTAKVGKERSRVVSSSARAKKAGSVNVPFTLSKSARAELRRRGSLRVTLTVRFRNARPQALTFTVKSATSNKGRR